MNESQVNTTSDKLHPDFVGIRSEQERPQCALVFSARLAKTENDVTLPILKILKLCSGRTKAPQLPSQLYPKLADPKPGVHSFDIR